MCQLEHWLCCVCEDAYVAINFFCPDVPPRGSGCPSTIRYERHIAARYCYYCSNMDYRGTPLVEKSQKYLEDLASLEGMLRLAVTIEPDDNVALVFSNWLMGFRGLTDVRPFHPDHPVLFSQSTIDHFARHLSPAWPVASFHLTSSELPPSSILNRQTAQTYVPQPYPQRPAPPSQQSRTNEQPIYRSRRAERRRDNRLARKLSQNTEDIKESQDGKGLNTTIFDEKSLSTDATSSPKAATSPTVTSVASPLPINTAPKATVELDVDADSKIDVVKLPNKKEETKTEPTPPGPPKPVLYSQIAAASASSQTVASGPRGISIDRTKDQDMPKRENGNRGGPKKPYSGKRRQKQQQNVETKGRPKPLVSAKAKDRAGV
ncbi:hypothetical protein F5Y11DRAFT_363724 [Daldinia sp. FL1419]|nr:hypothetical protein F5Y11DRAFT_363724 [Daldinia sp. FL1419]